MKKILLVILGLLMFYTIKAFFRRVRNAQTANSYTRMERPEGLFTNKVKNKPITSGRVVEEAIYTEIKADPGEQR
ncbi:MAG: hypothetical protein LC102_08460 [Ignavibacteriales bacterium]|nr:MAG: hypothetical protein F9K26_12530 [Ignavibacteriaceae bacterium]MBW7872723.1 hypothetical protein [Ignavibacteria bacterium]MCZ2143443.1 hypothetical protein [Ignavibacteriales bacterium]OQY73814.1 MAG: hypothetical protein B6D45_07645 [Ignavibacteriales bacterium UTCHB3]MBV6444320.1 hypothetical protein [Ignavibacteriaceae bacterium]